MLYVSNASVQRGWSNRDHLIDDSAVDRLISRRFRTWTALRAAMDRVKAPGFITVEYLDETTGEMWRRGNEPSLPGRQPLCRRI